MRARFAPTVGEQSAAARPLEEMGRSRRIPMFFLAAAGVLALGGVIDPRGSTTG